MGSFCSSFPPDWFFPENSLVFYEHFHHLQFYVHHKPIPPFPTNLVHSCTHSKNPNPLKMTEYLKYSQTIRFIMEYIKTLQLKCVNLFFNIRHEWPGPDPHFPLSRKTWNKFFEPQTSESVWEGEQKLKMFEDQSLIGSSLQDN